MLRLLIWRVLGAAVVVIVVSVVTFGIFQLVPRMTGQDLAFYYTGKSTSDAITKQDLPVIMGVTIVAALFVVLANLVVDVVHGFLDPRVRHAR